MVAVGCKNLARRLGPATAAVLLLAASHEAAAQVPAEYYEENCAACHLIGGGELIGPDLKDVTARRDRAWLTRFMQNPEAVIDSGDPYANQILEKAGGMVMPPAPGLTPALAEALLDLIEAESKLDGSRFAGVELSDRSFTDVDVRRGRELFTGEALLEAGGPSCLSCHTAGGVGALGGGKLGPDLTLVYERLQGQKGLGAWLSAPATPTMQEVYRQVPFTASEVEALLAFFEDAAKQRAEADTAAPLTFFLLGLGGAVLGLVLFDFAWKRRFRSVRRRLVDAVTLGGTR